MSKLDKDQIIGKFTQAYKSANGKEPIIEAKGGWYSIDGAKNVRLSGLEEMTAKMESGVTTADKGKKPVAKLSMAKKEKLKNSFSVREYWEQQIVAQNPGSKLPR